MRSLARVPPGRAGRLWLQRRLTIAERGLGLLERKLRILMMEHERLASEAERTAGEWAVACADAGTWTLRASLTGGRRCFRPPSMPADVTIRWADAMGTRYPADVTCSLPPVPEPLPCSAALIRARDTCRAATEAGVLHAVAQEAERVVALEVTATRQRIRALKDRRIPDLTAAMSDIALALDEIERSDAARQLRHRSKNGDDVTGTRSSS